VKQNVVAKIRIVGIIIGLALLLAPLAGDPQEEKAGQVWRIGDLIARSPQCPGSLWGTFVLAMWDVEYVEGRNLVIEIRPAHSFGNRTRGG
jgi:hypothetical protein